MRNWKNVELKEARQDEITYGSRVRSYDFPGSRDDSYVEGVVIEFDADRVIIAVDKVVWAGTVEHPKGHSVRAPLGVGSMSGQPAVFFIG